MTVCAACHGSDGKGRASLGPEIQHPPHAYATWVIRNGRKHPNFTLPMEAYPTATLSDAFLTEIFALLDAPAKPTTGAALYHDYCENCHGADGKGTLVGHGVAEPLSKYMEMVRSGHGGTNYGNRTGYMPSWTAQQLSDADVMAIFTYASKL